MYANPVCSILDTRCILGLLLVLQPGNLVLQTNLKSFRQANVYAVTKYLFSSGSVFYVSASGLIPVIESFYVNCHLLALGFELPD